MYQASYYDHKTYKTYIRDDEHGWEVYDYSPQVYKRVKKPLDGALPVLTGGWAIPVDRFQKGNPEFLEQDLNKELALLRDLYYQEDDKVAKYHNITYLDIEIEMGGRLTLEYIKASPMPLTAIALRDMTTDTKTCFIVDDSGEIEEVVQDGKHIIPCKNERELIYKFLDKWEELDPTIVVGYNSEFFDVPYLYFRIKKTLGESEANRLSPIQKVNIYDTPNVLSVRLGGINHLDYMLLHKKYIAKQEPSYKLKDIGLKYAKLEKIEYEGNLNQLFKRDKATFIDYNVRDVEILEALEKNLKFIELTIMISHICNTPYDQIYYNTILGEGAILKHLKREGIVSPNKPTTTNPARKGMEETYAGGYLLDPIPGLYFDVIDLDFTSLYPSIIKSINIGVETLVGRIVVNNTYEQNHSLEKLRERDSKEVITIQRLNKDNYKLETSTIKLGSLIELIEEEQYTISASGAIFRTDEQSVAAKVLEGWFEKREFYRGKKKDAGKKEDWVNFKLYDLFQQAFKILQNAMYGTFAKNVWRYTDGHMICSCAITNSGQRLTTNAIEFVNNKLQKETKAKKPYVIISDTDSVYIELKDIIKYKYGQIDDIQEKNKRILEIANEIQTEANNNLDNVCINLFNIPKNKYFQLKQEVIATTILTTGKRRYGMFITNKEGVNIPSDHKDALDLKGLEIMKSNMNPLFKEFGTNFIKDVLFQIPKDELDKKIIVFHKSLKGMDPKVLGKPSGVSYINKCIAGKAEGIFSPLVKNTKQNSRAAIVYNDLLKFKKLDKKYEGFVEGDRVFIIDLIGNPYKTKVIGLPNAKIPEEIKSFVDEYVDRDAIFESMICKKLRELYSDLRWDFPSLNENVGKFFKFS
jgi:DNA polymerase elongation subunit (family B)